MLDYVENGKDIAHYHSRVKKSLANCNEDTLGEFYESEHLSTNGLFEYLCACVCLHMLMQVKGFQHTRGLLGLLGCSGCVATASSPPSLVRFTTSTGRAPS